MAACGDNTATPVPAATTAAATTAVAATTAAATTAAATTAAATTASATTAAATTAAATTAAATTAAVKMPDLTAFSAAKGCKNVGVLLPETDTSARYEANDRPELEARIKAAIPGVTLQYANASKNADTQQNQAEAALTKGACILVLDPVDKDKASAIVQKAKASKVPVISYDRIVADKDLGFYVSFDNKAVGILQGQYIVDQYKAGAMGLKKGANLAMINGSQTDNNALLFRDGALSKLQPLIDSKDLNLVYDQYTPDWDNAKAQSLMDAVLTKQQNNLQIAYVANDGMANTVIASLRSQKLDGKVLVTGQDATVSGLQNILQGLQAMTVYKAIPKEAQATADLVAALSNGTDLTKMVNGATTVGDATIASVLLTPIAVDLKNFKDTVIADKFVSKDDICKGLPAGTANFC